MLDLNITVLFQMINFFVALYVLNILLIRPVRAVLRERKAKMEELSGEAAAFEHEAKERLDAYEAALAFARQEAVAAREQARAEGLTEQQRMVRDATQNAQTLLAEAQAGIRTEADAALAALRKRVKSLADTVAARVAG